MNNQPLTWQALGIEPTAQRWLIFALVGAIVLALFMALVHLTFSWWLIQLLPPLGFVQLLAGLFAWLL